MTPPRQEPGDQATQAPSTSRTRQASDLRWLVVSLVALHAFVIFILAVLTTRQPPPPQDQACRRYLKSIGIAVAIFGNYFEPPRAVILDDEGRPAYSWRLKIYTYVDFQWKLSHPYKYDEPWNSPANRDLVDEMPIFYACQQRRYAEIIMLFRGEAGLAASPGPASGEDVIIAQVPPSDILWTEPRDETDPETLARIAAAVNRVPPAKERGTRVILVDPRGRVMETIGPFRDARRSMTRQ